MMEQVLEGGMAADAGLSAATRHCLKDFHSRAWFVTMYADGSRVTQTSAGSRPGESWSDIVFGWVYSRILAKITEHAVAEDLIDVLPVDPSAGPYAGADGGMDAVASDATCVRSSSSSVSSTASSQTCAREKSAVMMVLRGPGSQRARKAHFATGGPGPAPGTSYRYQSPSPTSTATLAA